MFRTSRYLPIALVAGVLVTAPACASSYYGRGYGYGATQDVRRIAYDRGFRDGMDRGDRDARRGRRFDLERDDDYRDADNGYHREYGDRDFYRRSYRDGYRAGYTQAFNRYAPQGYYPPRAGGPYPAPPPAAVYTSPAARIGFEDGLRAGRDDGHDRDRYDPTRARDYRKADHGYDRQYGSRDQYAAEYRAGFERGYAAGYRQNGRF